MGYGQFSRGPCPAGLPCCCSDGPWSKWLYLKREERGKEGEETDRCREWRAGRKTGMGVGRGNRQTQSPRDPEQEKRQGQKEVTGARSMGEKSGERPRERVVQPAKSPTRQGSPHCFCQ